MYGCIVGPFEPKMCKKTFGNLRLSKRNLKNYWSKISKIWRVINTYQVYILALGILYICYFRNYIFLVKKAPLHCDAAHNLFVLLFIPRKKENSVVCVPLYLINNSISRNFFASLQ